MTHLPAFGRLRAQDAKGDGQGVPARPRVLDARTVGVAVLLALGSVVLVSLGLHVWGISGDLPYAPDVDEPIVMRAAVGMLQHHSLDPGWFGHPGSTVIYPIAVLVELWYQVARHVPPFAHAMPRIGRELVVDPLPFYVIGRLVLVAYGVGCVVVTWLLARRFVGNVGGVLAAMVLATSSMAVQYGQLVRTDMAGTFFALIAVWLAIRAMSLGRRRDWVLAAVGIGLAISTRYFYASLMVPYGAAAWLWFRSLDRSGPTVGARRRWLDPVVGLVFAPIAFAVTSPFVLFDLRTAISDIRFEARSIHPGADGLTPIGNLVWYLAQAIPATVGPIMLGLALVGAAVIARRDGRATTVLAAFVVSYLVAVSASPLHWDRYVIPLIPIVGICVAAAALAIGERLASAAVGWRNLAARARAPAGRDAAAGDRPRPLAVGIAAAIVVALVVPSVLGIASADRLRAAPSTRVLATRWIADNLPPASRIAEEMYTAYLDGTGHDVLRVFSLSDRSVDAYRAAGYAFLIQSSAIADRYQDAQRYPGESGFYRSLDASGALLASFGPDADHTGPLISIYGIAQP